MNALVTVEHGTLQSAQLGRADTLRELLRRTRLLKSAVEQLYAQHTAIGGAPMPLNDAHFHLSMYEDSLITTLEISNDHGK